VVDLNLIYVTLQEFHPHGGESVLRVPNSLFFQRATRRWTGEPPLRALVRRGGRTRRAASVRRCGDGKPRLNAARRMR
jgi:hypothetical protein